MIKSFKNKEAEAVFNDRVPKGFSVALTKAARRKLGMVHAASVLQDLRFPPGNKLHALEGDRAGQHAVRVNNQYRICFVWNDGDAFDVEIVDYH